MVFNVLRKRLSFYHIILDYLLGYFFTIKIISYLFFNA
jgi:hypothetical protein